MITAHDCAARAQEPHLRCLLLRPALRVRCRRRRPLRPLQPLQQQRQVARVLLQQPRLQRLVRLPILLAVALELLPRRNMGRRGGEETLKKVQGLWGHRAPARSLGQAGAETSNAIRRGAAKRA
jgi:hypothetical protein